ncbi:MAG: tRNA (adenosine(37)-N6)-threonylcarbamoyltransferase complex dimerization subunit type 1 TsaB [Flavobacteriaceae bacterium]
MAAILCIETSTTNCSVAISVDGKTIALKEENNKQYSHAEKLHLFIEDVLNEANIQKSQLDAIAVSKGPGSYTGLRIGVSSAKGLCFALDIPLISIPTLVALAYQVSEKDGIIIPMLDARRMEVYSAVFNSNKEEVRETQAEILDKASFIEDLDKNKVYFIGDGVEKFKNICENKNAVFIEDKFPSANEMGYLAELKHKKSDIENVAYFEPYYLKDFVTG